MRKLKLDEINNASGTQPPSKKRTRIKSPSTSQNQMDLPKRQETRNKSSSTRTKTQDLSTQISDLKTSLASLTSIVSSLTSNSRPRPASNGHNVELDVNVGLVQEVVHSVGQNPLLRPVGGGLPGTHASRIQNPLLPPVGGDFSTARYSRGQGQNSYQPNTAVSSSPVSFHSDWNADRSVHISDIELSKVTSDLCDSFSLLSHSDYQLCLRRREFIKPELNSEFRSLCASAPITELLFGNDICSQIRDWS